MLGVIAEELRRARSDGFVAYDCQVGKEVLAVPWVYGIQSDNPMQSELCAHIGMTGKFFCRVYHVRGKDKDQANDSTGEVERIHEFMQTHTPRHVSDTILSLKAQEAIALQGTFSLVNTEARKTGVKDKYLSTFLGIMQEHCNKEKANSTNKAGPSFLQKLRQTMLNQLYNPALLIPDLDVNRDTPVEVLHVILLGVVKYFWRDAVARQTPDGREILKAQINSLDLSGLGLDAPHGATLIAPFVLYDLLPPRAYNAWLALSHLGPLAFQPEIEDVDLYL
ncbi:hypothetical protein FRC07_010024, partial [Ceratobasidium sp. 392]